MTVYGYLRVSTQDQVTNSSLMDQRRVVNGLAMQHNLSVHTFIKDGGVSGSVPFLERIRAHGVELVRGDVVIVAKLDRYSRDLADALNSMKWCKDSGVRLVINGHGDVTDEQNLMARLMFEIMGAFAGHERRTIRARTDAGRVAKKAAGGHIGGSAPFGYRVVGSGRDAVLEKDPVAFAALMDAVTLRHEGMSLRHISGALFETHGVKVSHEGLRRALTEFSTKE